MRTDTTALAAAFLASFCFIFLRAFQQRNVASDNYGWVLPTSLLTASAEAVVIVQIANAGWHLPLVLSVGFGSGAGCLAAMVLHKRFVK